MGILWTVMVHGVLCLQTTDMLTSVPLVSRSRMNDNGANDKDMDCDTTWCVVSADH